MKAIRANQANEFIQKFASEPVWAVISTFAADSVYDSLTYAEARRLADDENRREPGRSATIVLVIEHLPEKAL
jgi:hypothetical protein